MKIIERIKKKNFGRFFPEKLENFSVIFYFSKKNSKKIFSQFKIRKFCETINFEKLNSNKKKVFFENWEL